MSYKYQAERTASDGHYVIYAPAETGLPIVFYHYYTSKREAESTFALMMRQSVGVS